MLMHNYALARCASADNIPQLFMTMGAMGGHMGKSGHACGGAYKTYAGAGGPALVKFGETGLPATKNALADTMPEPLMWQCIREGRYNSTGAAYGVNFNAEDIKETEFKWLNIEGRNTLQTAVGLSDAREAIQKLDFVTDLAYTFDTSAAYADIVLPCATEWERVGGFAGHQRSRETVVVYSRGHRASVGGQDRVRDRAHARRAFGHGPRRAVAHHRGAGVLQPDRRVHLCGCRRRGEAPGDDHRRRYREVGRGR